MEYFNALIILGRTGSGKSDIVQELSKYFPIEIITADKFYIYKFFESAICKPKGEYSNVRTHLFSSRDIMEDILERAYYADIIEKLSADILERNHLPVIEGCSVGYITAVLERNHEIQRTFYYKPAVGLYLPKAITFRSLYIAKTEQLLMEGALEEVREGLQKGWRNSYVMKKSMLCVPLIKYIDGYLTLDEAKELIIKNFMRIGDEEEEKFRTIDGVDWIEYDKKNAKDVVEKITRLISEKC